jgi:hypothetical protein
VNPFVPVSEIAMKQSSCSLLSEQQTYAFWDL